LAVKEGRRQEGKGGGGGGERGEIEISFRIWGRGKGTPNMTRTNPTTTTDRRELLVKGRGHFPYQHRTSEKENSIQKKKRSKKNVGTWVGRTWAATYQ